MRRILLLFAAAVMALAPAGAQQIRYLDPKDVSEAQREHATLVQGLGGAETGPRAAYAVSAPIRAWPTPGRRCISPC